MSFQTFESVPNVAVDQQYQATADQLSFPAVELHSIPTLGQQDAQLFIQQYDPATDVIGEVNVAQDESNDLTAEPNPSMEDVLRDIQKAYDNGLFHSYRDEVPSFYPALPGVVMVDENGIPIEEQPADSGE